MTAPGRSSVSSVCTSAWCMLTRNRLRGSDIQPHTTSAGASTRMSLSHVPIAILLRPPPCSRTPAHGAHPSRYGSETRAPGPGSRGWARCVRMSEDERHAASPADRDLPPIDTTVPHTSRIYDYLLGGHDHFEVDRRTAEHAFAAYPGGVEGARADARANRAFLGRVVRFLAGECGLRQFLDIGTGI